MYRTQIDQIDRDLSARGVKSHNEEQTGGVGGIPGRRYGIFFCFFVLGFLYWFIIPPSPLPGSRKREVGCRIYTFLRTRLVMAHLQLSRVSAAHVEDHGLPEHGRDQRRPRADAHPAAELEHGCVEVVRCRLGYRDDNEDAINGYTSTETSYLSTNAPTGRVGGP